MENRIKDQQLDLFAGRTSCHRWWPNQFRQLLSGLAWEENLKLWQQYGKSLLSFPLKNLLLMLMQLLVKELKL